MRMETRGILSVDPNSQLLPKNTDAVTRAMGISTGLYDMLGKHYENQFKSAQARNQNLDADRKAGTLQSDIMATNTKNQADTQYYPQELKAKIGEVMAKTGLSQAEAKAAIARSSESYALAALHNATRQNTGMQGQLLNQYIKDQKFGSKRSGAGGTYLDPETGQVITTPTNATTTQNQKTILANERIKPIIQNLMQNLPQFQTAKEKGALELQRIGNYFGGNYAKPDQYAQAQQDLELAPESLLKGFGLNVTNESLETMRKALEPIRGETSKGYSSRLNATLSQLSENQQQAMNAQSLGINVTPQQTQQVAGGFNGNPNVQPQQQQPQESRQVNGESFVKINGKWYHQ